jgi:hypothetical protein
MRDEDRTLKDWPISRTLDEDMLWGTYGKGGLAEHVTYGKALPEMKKIRLGDLETDHLEAILETQEQLRGSHFEKVIKRILKARADKDDERHSIRRRDAVEATKAQVSREEADKNGEGETEWPYFTATFVTSTLILIGTWSITKGARPCPKKKTISPEVRREFLSPSLAGDSWRTSSFTPTDR